MSTNESELPDWIKKLQEAFAGAVPVLEHLSHVATAQGAMGWMYRGDLEQARATIAGLPAEQLTALSVAATALAELAEERLRSQ